jgi:hypothetical protein
MCSKVEGRLEPPLALEVDGVKLVKRREKWNRGDSVGPSACFYCQSISQCNVILTGEEIAKNDGEGKQRLDIG